MKGNTILVKNLLIIKEKLVTFYAKTGVYLNHMFKFLLALITYLLIGRAVGTNELLSSPLIGFALAVLCAFVPVNVTVICATILTIIHLFGMSLELAIIATMVVLIIYLLYFRFAPNTGLLMVITPLLFYIKIPYVVPVIAALTAGITGIVPVVCGTFLFYLINFASEYSVAISTLDADSALQNITFIFNNILNNKELIVIIVAFSISILMIYIIKRLSVNYSWIIAILAGTITNAIVIIVSFSLLETAYNIGMLIGGTILAIAVGLILHLFIFSVNYSGTEYVQFEDNDYYYYVKAVPKVSVAGKDLTVKKINSIEKDRGFIHTESFDEEKEEPEDND